MMPFRGLLKPVRGPLGSAPSLDCPEEKVRCMVDWTVRQAVQRGLIPVVDWPGEDGEPIRRLLLDRKDVDEFVDSLARNRRPD